MNTLKQFESWNERRILGISKELAELSEHPIRNRKRIKYLMKELKLSNNVSEMIDFVIDTNQIKC